MSAFINAMNTNDTLTENAMPAHSTSSDYVLDFFAKSGAYRGKIHEGVFAFQKAYNEDQLLARKALFYCRDIRGGQGERELFRRIIHDMALKNQLGDGDVANIPFYGRWDDLMALEGTGASGTAVRLWAAAIDAGSPLASKWLPRRGPWFAWVRKYLEVSPGMLRRRIASCSKTVEQHMCAGEWDQIEYSHVPSQAGLKYRKAFSRHDKERYEAFIAAAKEGKVKINAGTLYPSDLVQRVGDDTVDALWAALPDYIGENSSGFVPVCDVSGSMAGEPMDVSIGLGLYLSERNKGPFKDVVITFSAEPTFVKLSGGPLSQRVAELDGIDWNMNTNIEKMFRIMLERAIAGNVPQSDMPSTLLIISDMQFDQCVEEPSQSIMELVRKKYEASGYNAPSVVFWNVRASRGQPAKATEGGVALVSGYSPSIMTKLLARKPQDTPMDTMMATLGSERYARVV